MTRRGLRQAFHVRIESAANGNKLLSSEKYRDRDYALGLATGLAALLGAGPVIEE